MDHIPLFKTPSYSRGVFWSKFVCGSSLLPAYPRFFRSGFALPELVHSIDYEATQGKLRGGDSFHVMIYLHRHEEGVTEYGFASSQFRPGFETAYLNHLQSLTKFITAFEVNGLKSIQMAQDCGINIAEVIGLRYHERPTLSEAILVPDAELRFIAALESRSGDKAGNFCFNTIRKSLFATLFDRNNYK